MIFEHLGLLLEPFRLEIAEQHLQGRLRLLAFDDMRVDVRFVAFRRFRRHIFRHADDQVRQGPDGIDHDVLRAARVDVPAVDSNDGRIRAEGLLVQLARCVAVDGVGERGAEFLNVEEFRAVSHLLIRREPDPDIAVKQRRVV